MSGGIGFIAFLPLFVVGAAGYGVVVGIKKLLEMSQTRPAHNNLPQRLDSVRLQTEQETQRRMAMVEAWQQDYEAMTHGLQSELHKIERESLSRFQQQQDEFIGELKFQREKTKKRFDQQHGEFLGMLNEQRRETERHIQNQQEELQGNLRVQKKEYMHLFEQQDKKLVACLEDERNERQQAIKHLQDQIDSITNNESRKHDASRSFVTDLLKIMEETNKLPHGRFAPGQMEEIRRHVEDACRSCDCGMYEAALSTAQKAYWDLTDLKHLVILREREFMLLHQVAQQEARSLLEEAVMSRQYRIEAGEGDEKDVFELDVDHWTRGELSVHEIRIQAVIEMLIKGENSLLSDDVKAIFEEIDGLRPKCGEIVEHARASIIASQLRSNLGELAVIALREQGFEIVDSAYEGDDERNSFAVKVRNIAGGEVVTVIAPVEGGFGKNSILVNSYDETFVDEATLHQRASEIVALLNVEGLQTDEPRCRGNARPEYRDISAVRQRKPSAITMQRGV